MVNDSQLWFLSVEGEKGNEFYADNIGFLAHFSLVHHSLLMVLCAEGIGIVELLNVEHYQARLVGTHGRDTAMHWFQELLDELNRNSQGKRGLGEFKSGVPLIRRL